MENLLDTGFNLFYIVRLFFFINLMPGFSLHLLFILLDRRDYQVKELMAETRHAQFSVSFLYSGLASCWEKAFWFALFACDNLLAVPEEACNRPVISPSGKANCLLGQNISKGIVLKTFSMTASINNKSNI